MAPAGARRWGRGALALGAALAAALGGCSRRGADFTPFPEAEVAGHRDAHEFRGRPLCQACHLPGDGLKADPIAVCSGCHHFAHGNHPVGVPAREARGDLPLWEGRLACHTCHDPHDVRSARAGLREPSPRLCLACHPGHGGKRP